MRFGLGLLLGSSDRIPWNLYPSYLEGFKWFTIIHVALKSVENRINSDKKSAPPKEKEEKETHMKEQKIPHLPPFRYIFTPCAENMLNSLLLRNIFTSRVIVWSDTSTALALKMLAMSRTLRRAAAFTAILININSRSANGKGMKYLAWKTPFDRFSKKRECRSHRSKGFSLSTWMINPDVYGHLKIHQIRTLEHYLTILAHLTSRFH